MINVSKQYKEIMKRPIRNKSFISITLGLINAEAQNSGQVSGDFTYWSYGNVFKEYQQSVEYATLEENYFKTDGSMAFMPENNDLIQLKNNGLTTKNVLDPVRIDFPGIFALKGIAIDFGSAYPTKFSIQTLDRTLTYENNSERFETTDVLGDTNYIIITPISMIGGMQRFRIKNILMGIGLVYTNDQTKNFKLSEYVSPISEELPGETVSFSFYDTENRFNVDDDNSFVDYLDTMQEMSVSFGLELDDGTVEWHKIATAFMKDWNVKNGQVTLNATDRLAHMEEKYTKGNKLYKRTAYDEAINILNDAGLTTSHYEVSDYLKGIELINPMPEMMHKECLQLVANACRCAIRQNEDGKIVVYPNFATTLDFSDFSINTNEMAKWGSTENIFIGGNAVYAELKTDFLKTDGSMFFMPENNGFLQTGYVSEKIADANGVFKENPFIEIILPAPYSYYSLNINFSGNPPKEMVIHTYNGKTLIGSFAYNTIEQYNQIVHDFIDCDRIVFEFTKGHANNRVLVDMIQVGELSDYILGLNDMLLHPVGYKEERVKSARAKIFTYQSDAQKDYILVEDNNYSEVSFGSVGIVKTIQNPLISNAEQARLVAEWVGRHYANNISYDVRYRGDPKLNAADIIRMENGRGDNLQVEILARTLNFDKKISGNLEIRRALSKTMEG